MHFVQVWECSFLHSFLWSVSFLSLSLGSSFVFVHFCLELFTSSRSLFVFFFVLFLLPAAEHADQRCLQAWTSLEGAAGAGGSELGLPRGDPQSQVRGKENTKQKMAGEQQWTCSFLISFAPLLFWSWAIEFHNKSSLSFLKGPCVPPPSSRFLRGHFPCPSLNFLCCFLLLQCLCKVCIFIHCWLHRAKLFHSFRLRARCFLIENGPIFSVWNEKESGSHESEWVTCGGAEHSDHIHARVFWQLARGFTFNFLGHLPPKEPIYFRLQSGEGSVHNWVQLSKSRNKLTESTYFSLINGSCSCLVVIFFRLLLKIEVLMEHISGSLCELTHMACHNHYRAFLNNLAWFHRLY